MTHIRDEINRLTASQRMLAHGLVMPQLGKVDLDYMDQQAETSRSTPGNVIPARRLKASSMVGGLSDEKIAYPMLENSSVRGHQHLRTQRTATGSGGRLQPSP